jgi:hypothetical protein
VTQGPFVANCSAIKQQIHGVLEDYTSLMEALGMKNEFSELVIWVLTESHGQLSFHHSLHTQLIAMVENWVRLTITSTWNILI